MPHTASASMRSASPSGAKSKNRKSGPPAACGVARSSKWREPFRRIVRLAYGPLLRFLRCMRKGIRSGGNRRPIRSFCTSENDYFLYFLPFNLENAVELVNPPDRMLLSIFSCLCWPPIWCSENRSCGPGARRTMRWNGSRHFELRATPHAAGGSQMRFSG